MDHTAPPARDTSAVIELRQYTLHPGRRDELIELFEREFIEPQEAAGMRVIGTFRQQGKPDRFVWLRGFRDMSSRATALQSFYGGPVWKANRTAANATMIDSDNVLLLRPVDAQSGFVLPAQRPSVGSAQRATTIITATLYLLTSPVDADFLRFFDSQVSPVMAATGAAPIARFQTEYAQNSFPALPVRTGEHAFVWFAAFATPAEHQRHAAELAQSPEWRERVAPALAQRLASPAEELVLEPTARSLLGHLDPPGYTLERTGDVHDFDFLAGGRWIMANRRLKLRGVGSQDWDEFPGTSRATLHMGGVVNSDENQFTTKGWTGMTVRLFNTEKRQWAIYWIDSRKGVLFPPVFGGFEGNRGEFYGEDTDDGRPVKARFIWTRLGADTARWEQAFSYDDRTWETNWTIDLKRVRE